MVYCTLCSLANARCFCPVFDSPHFTALVLGSEWVIVQHTCIEFIRCLLLARTQLLSLSTSSRLLSFSGGGRRKKCERYAPFSGNGRMRQHNQYVSSVMYHRTVFLPPIERFRHEMTSRCFNFPALRFRNLVPRFVYFSALAPKPERGKRAGKLKHAAFSPFYCIGINSKVVIHHWRKKRHTEYYS